MPRVLFSEYRDQYENSVYPFADTATLRDYTSTLEIPKNIFLDAGFCFPSGTPYLSGIEVFPQKAVVTVSSDADTAQAELNFEELPDVFYFRNAQGRSMGCIVSESVRLNWFASLEEGSWTFYPESASFSLRCNIPCKVLGVSSIGTEDTSLYGDVWLAGADGVYLRSMGEGKIRIDILGEVLHRRAQCSDPRNYETPVYLKTLNTIPPDVYGNLTVGLRTHHNRVRFITTPDGLEVKRV